MATPSNPTPLVLANHRGVRPPSQSHRSRALGLMCQLDNMRRQTASLLSALDHLPVGVMLLNPSGQLVHANNAARSALGRGDGLTCSHHARLDAAPAHPGQARLSAWLQDQCLPAATPAASRSHTYLVRRTGGQGLYSLQCCPLDKEHPWQVLDQVIGAVVLVTDPHAMVLPDVARLIALYALTPAQAQVARELAHSKSSKEVARNLGVSPETVRSHTRQVYEKMHVNSQPELVRAVLTLGQARV